MSDKTFLGQAPHVWNGMSGTAALVGAVAIVVGVPFGVFEYFERKEAARASETLRMIEAWEQHGVQKAYLDLSQQLENLLSDVPKTEHNDTSRETTLRDNLARRAIRGADADAYDQVVYFFTRLSLCVELALCSERVAATFFEDSLDSFLSWFADEIARRVNPGDKMDSGNGRMI